MKSLGLLSFLVFGAGVIFMLRRWPADYTKTFSQNAARSRATIVFYAVLVMVFLGLLSAFTFGWLIPSLHLSLAFSASVGLGVAAEVAAALVPETEGWKAWVHRVAAGIMYFATLVMVGVLALSVGGSVGWLVGLIWLVMVATVALALGSARIRRHAVLLQAVHLSALAAAIVLATYTS